MDDGGQGSVYFGCDDSGRPAAIKVPKRLNEQGPQGERRQRREPAVLLSLDHEGIVKQLGHGSDYLAMEYIAGPSLDLAIHRPLYRQRYLGDDRRLAAVFMKIAQAFRYLHGREVVHRDLKPRNVGFRPNGDPVLFDFGLARSTSDSASTVMRIGTMAYWAPEQDLPPKNGFKLQEWMKIDVYQFGATLFEAVTRKSPAREADSTDSPFGDGEHRRGPGHSDPRRSPRTRGADVTSGCFLGSLIRACIHEDPQKRPDWGEIIGVLEAAQAGGRRRPRPASQLAVPSLY